MAAGLKNKYLVEIVGTFILVYAICSAATGYSTNGTARNSWPWTARNDWSRFSSCLGFNCNSICYRISLWSQVNPAVTIGLLVARKMGRTEAGLTIACQILGAVIAAAVVFSMFGSEMAASVTLPADDNVTRAFILETVMTFTLVYVVLATTTSKNFKIAPLAGVAIGFTLGFNVILGGSISGDL